MTGNALYYPYIHIRDVNWLKANLLLFPQVQRMVPFNSTPDDNEAVAAFTQSHENKSPLLSPADLWSRRVIAAQEKLAGKLTKDAEVPAFRQAYGFGETRKTLSPGDPGFQIHQGKLEQCLRDALRDSELAWAPEHREPYDISEYVELHPRVGQAVMSTLAIACALHDGLSIVGDQRSEELHRCLIEQNDRAIYDAWLHPEQSGIEPLTATGEELFEFIIGFACEDLSALTPERLASMHEDREPIRDLLLQLREQAHEIPRMDPGPRREEYFEQATSDILKKWRGDRANMSHFWREFFGEGLVDAGKEFGKDALKSFGTEVLLGGFGMEALHRAFAGGEAHKAFVEVGGGLVVGMVAHAANAVRQTKKKAVESPFRYLTAIEKAGVAFRSDAKQAI